MGRTVCKLCSSLHYPGSPYQVGKTAGSVLLAPYPEKLEAFYSNL